MRGDPRLKSSKRRKSSHKRSQSLSLSPDSEYKEKRKKSSHRKSQSSSLSSDNEYEERRKKSSHKKRQISYSSSDSEYEERRKRHRDRSRDKEIRKSKKERRERKRNKHKKAKKDSQDSVSELSNDSQLELEDPKEIVCYILHKFPDQTGDLKQVCPCLEVVGSLFMAPKSKEKQSPPQIGVSIGVESYNLNLEGRGTECPDDVGSLIGPRNKDDSPAVSKRRVIGPDMPSAEVLAAAAKLTEAEAQLREAEMELDNDGIFIGPPPPIMVAEAESANDAERFEEVSRIIGAEDSNPYEVLGLNREVSAEFIKKRYWKMSLLVHPDKCPHPEAQQAFVKLNQSFKDLMDPEKRGVIDEKIKEKEELEEFKAEMQACREAAHWRQIRGESLPGDEELLGGIKPPPKREEWMTTLPPERKAGVSMQSMSFSKGGKEGRGDTSVWTDTPLDKTQKARMNYLEAYDHAAALGASDGKKEALARKRDTATAEIIDAYNKSKRSTSLVEKHKQEASKPKKKHKEKVVEEWSGQHPWKPWDREKDLTAGRQKVQLDPESMAEGLSSRFSSGSFQRNFL
ncbi:DNA topoisomerase 1 isoform X2 [Amborella trichopoda]|uniref:DNA topoisomerase 1 isoform X2 n=1 Tax=Amborella trichopoda TaxID=13333 RepID=UPI0009BDA745|nr:DNA topoisomerase 1 isoform X2 [Amborella trichopoda]|eukprot:XP_020518629.1 DNA topoisomerase 1 isoform X2 [Amborella trichopoda]